MAVHEVICGTCGAINRDAVEPCWRCLEALEPLPHPHDAVAPAVALDRAS